MVAIVSNKREAILKAVEDMYTEVADRPAHPFHFPTGRRAAELVGYPPAELDALPPAAVESFAGVGYPFAADVIRAGDTVLDIGSGSGTDALLAARRAGLKGKVYALDLTAAMRTKLARNIAAAGAANIEILAGNAEQIPLPDQSVDAVTSNGVLNLVPDKTRAIREILRVLKPGGRLQISDIALAKPITGKAKRDPKLWAECIVGAVEEDAYLDLFRETGFKHVEHVSSFDYFAHARGEDTRLMAGYFGAHAITFRARRPEAFEQAGAPSDDAAIVRLARSAGGQFAGIGGAIAASTACFGAPVLVSAASAVGALMRNGMFCLFLGTVVAAPAAEQAHTTNPESGIETWEIATQGVSLRLTQILPDQVRGFYLARGFGAEAVELLAAGACVFQTVFRNESAPGAIEFNLADWRIVTAGREQPLKLEHDWQKEWAKRGIPASARMAFRYALYPTEHHYDIGDWNMGMTTYALPLGSRFDLRFVWREGGKRREAVLSGVRCATESPR